MVGVIIAGGRARRFGAEKAMALLEGRPLAAHVATALRGCSRLAVNCRPFTETAAWAERCGLERLPDPPGRPDAPLCGVLAALEWGARLGADLVATAPCDAPALPVDLVCGLSAALAPGAGAAFAATSAGPEPLCALWRTSAAGLVASRIEAGRLSVRDALEAAGARPVRFEAADGFVNVNTRQDLQALRARRDRPGPISRPTA